MTNSTGTCKEQSRVSTANSNADRGVPALFLSGLIHLYRWTLSPLLASLGARCRYYPSCSQYALDALSKYGAYRGSKMAARRVLRCHPWHEGGYDPVE